MPKQDQAMKGPTHGGDDDSSGSAAPEAPKKIDLRKYINKPDLNIRDLFWTIMKGYAEKQNLKEQLKNFYGDRMSLLRIAMTVVKQPERFATEDMEIDLVAFYTIQMILDEEWQDVFEFLISETYDMKNGVCVPFMLAMGKLCENKDYYKKILDYLNVMLVDNVSIEAVLAYVAEMNNLEMIKELKKELIIIATEDIDQNQHYALFALSALLKEDEQVRNTVITQLNSWDEETRKIAATVLRDLKDKKLVEAVKKYIPIEENEQVKKIMEEILEKNKEN